MELTAERNTPSIENKVKGGKCLSISCRPEDCLKTIHSLDKRMSSLEGKVDKLDSFYEILVELKTISRQQVEDNLKRDNLLKEQGNTLIEVSLALKNMNTKIEYTEATVNKLSKKVEVMSEANTIKIPDIIKNITLLIIGGVAGAVLNLIIGG